MLILLYAYVSWLVRRKDVRSHLKRHSWEVALGLFYFNVSWDTSKISDKRNYKGSSWLKLSPLELVLIYMQIMFKSSIVQDYDRVLINWSEAD